MPQPSVDVSDRPSALPSAEPEAADADARRRRLGPWWLIPLATAGLCVPLIVALAGLRRPVWTPVLDLAMTELRVRDVGGAHTPLIGLPGRIGPSLQQQGSHPGPLSFYALAPTYRALGSTAWALQVGTVVIHAVAIGTSLWLGRRRAGLLGLAATAAGLALLLAAYGGAALTEPWNPYLPLLCWVVTLLATWSVLEDDRAALIPLVAAGSFCAQTHVPYLGLALGLGALAVGSVLLRARAQPGDRASMLRWLGAALALGVVLWLPPTVDQIRHDPGNYRTLLDHFSDPPEEPAGLRTGARAALEHLDVVHLARSAGQETGWLVTSADGNTPSAARGVVLLGAWAVAAVLCLRQRRALLPLHAVAGASFVLMVLALSRIFGTLWYYLSLWGWAIGLLLLAAALATLGSVRSSREPIGTRQRWARITTIALAGLALAVTVRFTVTASDSPHGDARVAAQLALVVDDTAAAIDDGAGAATPGDGRYVVSWADAFHIGSQGYGMLSELERRGIDAYLEPLFHVPATEHRALDPADATARVVLATGSYIDEYRAREGAVEVAYGDLRSPEERAEEARLRAELDQDLRAAGLDEVADQLDTNVFGAALDPRLDPEAKRGIERLLEIGGPLAVFVVPPDATEA
ncbi:MAG: hypothetical protein ACJ739_12745 [Acidimicrobiales bacterium]